MLPYFHHHYLPSPITTSPTDTRAPLGYRAAGIKMRALLPSTSRRTDIPEADMPPRKTACLTTPAPEIEVKENSAAGTARQPGPTEFDPRRYRVEKADFITADSVDYSTWTYRDTRARDLEPQEGPAKAGSSCVAAALAVGDADRSRNGDNSNDSGTSGRRQMTTPRECTYTDFLKCQPMSFQGIEGVVGLTRWLEKMESVL
uniref:Reverse transcriptase domain-containing protein n=1 Tax=Tanacetum cinerariifolium TaxID=118510 RepID=A0A699KTY8_TANCI|nr:hypothetical protein [Tanacetum cinerariifolium]